MICVTICLPIPAREISPNAARGQSRWAAIKKSKIVKKHRWEAMAVFKARLENHPDNLLKMKPIGYSLEHFFPTVRFRDEDNADGACKAYRDGICDALGIDDSNFCKLALSTRAKDAKNPRVDITVFFIAKTVTPPIRRKCEHCTEGYVQDAGFVECNHCNSPHTDQVELPFGGSSESNKGVIGVTSHSLFGRLLFVYALNGVVKCFSAEEIRQIQSAMLDIGWKHTATIDPARWIEAMANGNNEPLAMLDELQFSPPNA